MLRVQMAYEPLDNDRLHFRARCLRHACSSLASRWKSPSSVTTRSSLPARCTV